MKTLKCLAALALGSLLGLVASCTRPAPENKAPGPSGEVPGASQTNAIPTNSVPARLEDLPVRQPMLE